MLSKISLDGIWNFALDPQDRGLDWCKFQIQDPVENYPEGAGDLHNHFDDLLLDEVTVPGSWQLYRKEYSYYDRVAFFFRNFEMPELTADKRVFLHFGAVCFRAQVWLNDQMVGKIDHPYLPFNVEITKRLKKNNYLVVRVEASARNDDTVPQLGWDNCPGIIQSVELQITGRSRLNLVHVTPEINFESGSGRLKIKTEFDPVKKKGDTLKWNLSGNGLEASGTIEISKSGFEFHTAWSQVDLWSPTNPALYDFRLELLDKKGEVMDCHMTKTGFRTFTSEKGNLLLNGQNIFLRGISRHNLHPEYGMTLPIEKIREDLGMIVELGCNFVRLPHYPQDPRVLYECDRLGLLVWVEIPVYWNAPLEKAVTRKRMLAQMENMVRRDYNHPSVVIWSMANEIHSDRPEALKVMQECRDMIRSYDAKRPITFASWPCNAKDNLAMQSVDICCLNRYRGWYDPEPELIKAELEEMRKAFPDKPLLLSEFGAGARPEFHDPQSGKWSEEYQAELLEKILKIAREHSNGTCIWTLADFRDPSRVPMKISDGFINNKGLVTADREHRKMAFDRVKKIYHDWKKTNVFI